MAVDKFSTQISVIEPLGKLLSQRGPVTTGQSTQATSFQVYRSEVPGSEWLNHFDHRHKGFQMAGETAHVS